MNIKGIKNISKKGKKRIAVEFDIPDRANSFLNNHPFIQDQDIDVFIPARMVCSRGVVKNVGSDITKEDFLNFAQSRVTILDARQLNRRVVRDDRISYEPSNTWVVTFKGKNLPDKIGLWGCIRHVSLYVGPVIQCYNCLRYGHTKTNCHSPLESKRCRNCGENHDEAICSNSDKPKCIFCDGKHASTLMSRI